MELNPKELAIDAIVIAQNLGRFVADRLIGGAWADLPHSPEPANIQVYDSNIERGQE